MNPKVHLLEDPKILRRIRRLALVSVPFDDPEGSPPGSLVPAPSFRFPFCSG
jgi:hypothetical protein